MRPDRPCFTRTLITAGITAALGFTILPASAAPEHGHDHPPAAISAAPPNAEAARQKAFDHTQNLVALQKQWVKARGADKSRALVQLVNRAEERRAYLLELMADNPEAVLNAAIPEDKQVGLPAEVLEKLEQKLELQGELEVFYEDYEDGSHRLRHILKTPFGERFELHLAGKQPQLQHGHQVRMTGLLMANPASKASDGDIVLDSSTLMLAAGSETGVVTDGTAATNSATFGAQSTLVVNINFSDNSSQPWTPEQARSTVFDQASDFIHENSFGQTWLSGDVTPWLTLPISSASCDTTSIVSAAQQAAIAAGYNTDAYNRLVYAMPFTSGCGFSGVGSVGGSKSIMLINGSMYWFTVAHEMGHNLGLYHSHALECGSEITGSNCSNDEYGDGVDIMGRVSAQFTAFQKERLGWLDSRHLLTPNSSGIYELEPYATLPGNLPKALKIPKGTDPVSGEPAWYYVEYRQGSGYDSILAGNANVQNGVVVHTGITNQGNSSYMLDMTPGSAGSNYTDTRDPALEVGQQFTDAEQAITLATEWVDGSRASVNVQFGDALDNVVTDEPIVGGYPLGTGRQQPELHPDTDQP